MTNLVVTSFQDTLKKPVQVVNAKSLGEDFSLLDRKILNILMGEAVKENATKTVHRISLRKLADYLRMSGHESMDRIHRSIERLCHGEIEIKYRDDVEGEVVINCHYLSTQRTTRADGWLEFAFDQILLRFLHNPKVYSIIQLPVMRKFKTSYALHLYEVMVGKLYTFRPTWKMSLDEALEAFEITAGSTNSRTDHFKSRVVDKAVEEINQFAEFDVEVEYERSGRGGKVSGLTFSAAPKSGGRLVMAADAVRTGRKAARPDRDTVDLFTGVSDSSGESAPPMRLGTLEEARRMVGEGGDVAVFVDGWTTEFKGRFGIDPDETFLAWLRLQLDRKHDEDLEGVDVDAVFKNFLFDEH